jgi:nucleoside phosphorylase
VDYSLHRLRHYTGTRPAHFQNFVLFTNYQFYIDEFIRLGHELMADTASGHGYEAFVEPGNVVTRRADLAPQAEDAEGTPPPRLPQMPAYHLVRGDHAGITMVNIGVGPANAKTITDHIAVLRPHAWIMLGHCAGLRNSQHLARAVRHPADDAAQHALPVHRLPHGLPALARRGCGAGRPGAGAGAAPALARRPARHGANKVEALPPKKRSPAVQSFASSSDRYLATIGPAIAFLQGRDSRRWRTASWAATSCPRGRALSRWMCMWTTRAATRWAGPSAPWACTDRAKHLATLYLNDLADVLRDAVDERFEFVRYAESLAGSQPTFEPLAQALAAPPTLVDELLRELTLEAIERHRPPWCCCRCPSPARCMRPFASRRPSRRAPAHRHRAGRRLCQHRAARAGRAARVRLLRLRDAGRGERPLLALLEHLQGKRGRQRLVRTFVRDDGAVQYINMMEADIPLPRWAPPPGTACRWTATCRCSTCSTPCTGCGATGAGTSSPWRTAATGRSAASAT